jgi:hypothetical protein
MRTLQKGRSGREDLGLTEHAERKEPRETHNSQERFFSELCALSPSLFYFAFVSRAR